MVLTTFIRILQIDHLHLFHFYFFCSLTVIAFILHINVYKINLFISFESAGIYIKHLEIPFNLESWKNPRSTVEILIFGLGFVWYAWAWKSYALVAHLFLLLIPFSSQVLWRMALQRFISLICIAIQSLNILQHFSGLEIRLAMSRDHALLGNVPEALFLFHQLEINDKKSGFPQPTPTSNYHHHLSFYNDCCSTFIFDSGGVRHH